MPPAFRPGLFCCYDPAMQTARLSMGFAAFLYGAAALVVQTLIARELLSVFVGNEFALGVVYGSWFLGVALGATIASRFRMRVDPAAAFAFALLALGVVAVAEIPLIRSLRLILDVPPGQWAPPVTLAAGAGACVILASVWIGLAFPFACGAWPKPDDGTQRPVAIVYALEAFGGLAAGLVYTFVLIRFWPPAEQAFFCLAMAAAGAAWAGRRLRFGPVLAAVAAVAVIVWAAGGADRLEDASDRFYWTSTRSGAVLAESFDTRYQRVHVGERGGQTDVYAGGQYVTSFPDAAGNGEFAQFAMAAHENPKRVLVVGAASEMLAQYILPHGVTRLDLVDIDGKLHERIAGLLGQTARAALLDPRVRFHVHDGRRFVANASGYDVIWLRQPDPSTLLAARYYTKEFFDLAKDALAPGGAVVLSMTGSANYAGKRMLRYLGSVDAALRAVFTHVTALPGDTVVFLGSDAPVTLDPAALVRRVRARGAEVEGVSPEALYSWIEPGRIAAFREDLGEADSVPNTDDRPVAVGFHLWLWQQFAGGSVAPLVALAFAAGVLLLAIGILRVRRAADARLAGGTVRLFATGLVLFSLEIVLLLVYQNRYGTMAEKLGALFALYMAGAAAGALVARAVPTERARSAIGATEIAVLTGVAAVALVAKLPASPQVAIWILNALLGAAGGLQFAAAGAAAKERNAGAVAAALERADHLGTMIGALFAALLLVPWLGISGTCAALFAVKTALLLVARAVPPRG